MTEEEITALAREYAEDMAKGPEFEGLPNCLKANVLELNADYVAGIFRWLCERFCLVEKSKIKEMWKEITNLYLAHQHITYDGARYLFNEVFFPEIAKEVEG